MYWARFISSINYDICTNEEREREREREREETLHTFTLRILEHRDANNKVVYLHMFVFLWRTSGNVLALVKFWNWKND